VGFDAAGFATAKDAGWIGHGKIVASVVEVEMDASQVRLPYRQVMNQFTLEVRIDSRAFTEELTLRLWFAKKFIRLAAWILGVNVSIDVAK